MLGEGSPHPVRAGVELGGREGPLGCAPGSCPRCLESRQNLSLLPRFPGEATAGFINSVLWRRVTPPPDRIALMVESTQRGMGPERPRSRPSRAAAPGQGTPGGGLQGSRPPARLGSVSRGRPGAI